MTGYALSSWAYGCWPLALVLVLAGLLAWSILRRPESDDEPLSPGSLAVIWNEPPRIFGHLRGYTGTSVTMTTTPAFYRWPTPPTKGEA